MKVIGLTIANKKAAMIEIEFSLVRFFKSKIRESSANIGILPETCFLHCIAYLTLENCKKCTFE